LFAEILLTAHLSPIARDHHPQTPVQGGIYCPLLPPTATTMASSRTKPPTLKSEPSPPSVDINPQFRRLSSISNHSPTLSSPRVQLLPHSRTPSYDASFSPEDIELLANTSFDARDISSKDFDFEDVFTYDKPQRKLKSVVEVSSPARDCTAFSSSNGQPEVVMRQKFSRTRSRVGEKNMKTQGNVQKR